MGCFQNQQINSLEVPVEGLGKIHPLTHWKDWFVLEGFLGSGDRKKPQPPRNLMGVVGETMRFLAEMPRHNEPISVKYSRKADKESGLVCA